MSTIETFKIQAKRLRAHLARHNMPVTHSQSLEAVAAIHGHRDWNTALAALTRPPTIQAPLLLEVTQDSTPEHLHSSLQSLLRLAPEAIRFQLASNVSEEMVRVAQDLAAQIERAGTTVIFDGTVRPHVSTLRPTGPGKTDSLMESMKPLSVCRQKPGVREQHRLPSSKNGSSGDCHEHQESAFSC